MAQQNSVHFNLWVCFEARLFNILLSLPVFLLLFPFLPDTLFAATHADAFFLHFSPLVFRPLPLWRAREPVEPSMLHSLAVHTSVKKSCISCLTGFAGCRSNFRTAGHLVIICSRLCERAAVTDGNVYLCRSRMPPTFSSNHWRSSERNKLELQK